MHSWWKRHLKVWICGLAIASLSGCVADGSGAKPESRAEAWRFLTQATFGADEVNIDRVMTMGYEAWIDEQFSLHPAFTYRDFFTRRDAEIKADHPGDASARAGADQTLEAFFTRALTDKAQLRARLAFALSEIMVISCNDDILGTVAPQIAAGYMDTLDSALDGSYRDLLEAVAKSPAMGQYLTYRGNTKEVPSVGHFPDENFAREIMQLFSIGLNELNSDGSKKLDGNGNPIETYTSDDVKGLAKVFTGWGNYRGAAYSSASDSACFFWAKECQDPEGFYQPMVPYPAYHSVSEKKFLGVTIPAQDTPSPQADLTTALNRLATHPNTAPFISKQLIQRLVTSNPTPDYVARVAERFTATGGNLKEVVKAILLDDEARGPITLVAPEHGKLREPVLRLTALLRAFKFNTITAGLSASPMDGANTTRLDYVAIGNTSDPATSWGQAPLYAPSVFNYFRPGYAPPQGEAASKGMVVPEMQLVNESSVTGYVNAVLDLLTNGIGPSVVVDTDGQCGAYTLEVQQYIQSLDPKVPANKALQDAAAKCKLETLTQRSVTMQLIEQRAMAYDASTLTQHIADRLLGGSMTDKLRQAMISTLSTLDVPALSSQPSSGDAVNSALDKRVWTAILMVAVSPEFLVTK
ncbi:MAG: DUF1800 domain-containing protein [Aquabacterium sp.]|uniref:DUF1800 domain-containing protein n=1 Tax=Aquabacterium sp. TaxID=1872578 RepID=UPI0025BB9EC3|nr:DUF1800 domain-containing protein [Aquabacterium sp.]MBI3382979.1 DUF1800 domain-containing protein [Aquabacterium sp.]